MDGILNIYKPTGPTSFGIVSAVKRLTGEKRVGHAGTLDPAASGVLPVCLGRATRISEYFMDASKTYRAEIELGKTTDTYDSEGVVTSENNSSKIDRKKLETALEQFRGVIQQVPPVYSALKHQGRPYYKLARAGIQVEIKSRPVTVYSIEIIDWNPPLITLDVTCGKGTYIRSLAHDLGQQLGCGAYMKNLIRRRCGIFSIENAVSPEELRNAVTNDYLNKYIYPVDSVLQHLRKVVVNEDIRQKMKNGQSLVIESGEGEDIVAEEATSSKATIIRCRAYSTDGYFLGILRFDPENKQWRPEKIFF